MAVDPEIQALLDFLAAADRPAMSAGTPDEARQAFRTLAVDLRDPSSAPEVASIEEVKVTGGAGELPARVYRPHTAGPLPTIVFFHGGGWVIGDLDTHDPLARLLAVRCDAVVVSVDYRLAPENPFPAAVDDAVAATRWAAEHLDSLGGGLGLAVAGDSAGGNLSAVVAQVLRGEVPLAGQLLLYPGTDMLSELPSRTENGEGYFLDTDVMQWFGMQYAGDLAADPDRLTDPRLSPLRGELAGLPPAVVVVAEFDPLRDEGAAYAHALEKAGVRVELRHFDGLIHGFLDMLQYSAAAREAGDETCRLFRDLLRP
jgi:acetyl esterase